MATLTNNNNSHGSSSSSSSVVTTTSSTSAAKATGGTGRAGGVRTPIASAKTVVINRTLPGGAATYGRDAFDGSSVLVAAGRTFASASPLQPGSASGLASGVLTGREREKREMQELNERFATYIEKVRFLEAQNRKLSDELHKLKESWGKETEKVKSLYEGEMEQLRSLLDDSEKYKAGAEVRVTSLDDQLNELQQLLDETNRLHSLDRDTIDKLNQQMADCDAEISLLRRRVATFSEERARDQAEVKRLRQDVARLRQDLDSETLNHINAENCAQSLREELEFQRVLHESELKELASLAYRDTTSENREFWKIEMAQALSDIRREYDSKLEAMRSDAEVQYGMRLQEARTSSSRDGLETTRLKEENRRLKAQAAESRGRLPELEGRNSQLERELEELRRELEEAERQAELEGARLRTELAGANATLEDYAKELQTLMDAKLSLELEIHAYRKLLEGEEVRINHARVTKERLSTRVMEQQQTVTTIEQQNQARQHISLIKGEMSAKTTYQRTAKGSLGIQECHPEGKFIVLEHNGKKKEDLSNWTLVRNIDNGRLVVKFTFPKGTILDGSSAKTMKIWAQGHKPADSKDPETAEPSWGIGASVITTLANADGEERATHTQKTVYSAN